MASMKALIASFMLALGGVAQAGPADDWLRDLPLPQEQVGLIAVPLDGGAPLLEHNADRAMNPASTMKIVTTFAALSMTGPQYRWRTRAFLRGRLEGGVLRGDLVIAGGGDPKFVVEDLTAFAIRMREAGLREIRGDVVLDDSAFDLQGEGTGPLDGDGAQPYNVAPNAAMMNFKAARLVVTPQKGHVHLSFDPELAGVRIENRVRETVGPCEGGADALRVDTVSEVPPVIRVSGNYARTCLEQGAFVAVLSHRAFAEALFKAVWRSVGGTWSGHARTGRVAPGDPVWLEWLSPRTLADVVRDVNKYSNNVMARSLFLGLGADSAGVATPARARTALANWLGSQSLSMPELYVENGAGLSRSARISPAHLAALLVRAAASPVADLLRESLPVVGVDGTMKARMTGEAIAGGAWIKTGSLEGVRAIAGYVDGASGRRWAVVMIVNGLAAKSSRPVQDEFLRRVRANG